MIYPNNVQELVNGIILPQVRKIHPHAQVAPYSGEFMSQQNIERFAKDVIVRPYVLTSILGVTNETPNKPSDMTATNETVVIRIYFAAANYRSKADAAAVSLDLATATKIALHGTILSPDEYTVKAPLIVQNVVEEFTTDVVVVYRMEVHFTTIHDYSQEQI